MTIPFEPRVFGIKVNVHLVLEYLAFFIGFRYYLWLRKSSVDHISNINRISILLGATIGAFLGSRIAGFFENPVFGFSETYFIQLLNAKTIMGGLFGGLIGVEVSKKIIHEKQSSGDLFVFPIISGIFIGRIGCFLSGVTEFTYGKETNFFTGMDLGDGKLRHPLALYELVFLILLFILLKQLASYTKFQNGLQFKLFMIAYFGFRFLIEFLKPNVFYVAGLSSIQWLCLLCWIYYLPTFKNLVKHAY